MRVEKHDLGQLAADFDRAGQDITKKVTKVTGMACNQMKRDAKQRVDGRGLAHLPHLGRSFTYDVTTRGDTVTGEVGAEHERLQGKLDVFIENGTPTSPPIPHWAPAADKEVPVWHRYLDDVAAEAFDA
jgi:hypothetical protein